MQGINVPGEPTMKTYRVIGLSVVFFVLVCISDAFFESVVFPEKSFWNALAFDVSGHAMFLRSIVTLCFLAFGMIVSSAFARMRAAERSVAERSIRLEESNRHLEREIRTRAQVEKELIQSEERYRTVADFTHDWESWTDVEGKFLWISPSCSRVTGYSAEEFLRDEGMFRRIVHPEDLPIVTEHLRQSLKVNPDITYSLDFRITHRNGEVRWINHVCQAVRGKTGNLLGRRSSNRDITERRHAEEAVRESQEKYKALYVEAKRSEELYRSLLDSSPDAIVIYDLPGHPQYINDSFVQTFGWTMDDLMGRRIPFVPDSESEATAAAVRRIMADGKAISGFETKRFTKTGEVIDVRLSASRFHDSAGSPAGMLVILRDVTERKKAEEETRRMKALLDTIIENLPSAVFLKHATDFRYCLWNKTSRQLYGYSGQDVIGRTAHEVFSPLVAEAIALQDRETLQRRALLAIPEQAINTANRGRRIFHTKMVPIFDEDGTPRYIVGISEDITDRKAAEKALVRARETAEQASLAKSEFLANMSHEIRTPMNGIMGMTELALNTELTEEQHEYLEAVRTSADSLLKLINDILDFSKIEAGKLDLVSVDFSLRDAIADTMTVLAVQAHRKKLELAYDIPIDLPDALMGDPGRLRQILVNLVGNSIKFTEEGEVVVRVVSALESHEEIQLHFSVSDTGIGIPPDKTEKIFSAFEQADGSTSRKYGGTGLGLAITSRFVQLMGGTIWVDSTPGNGSVFHFTVSFGLRSEHEEPAVQDESVPLKGLRVLVVDDNATNRKILEQNLRPWGVEPVLADSGPQALEAMAKAYKDDRPFRLVITDCMMPGMDGFEFASRLRRDHRLNAPTVIMLTSSGERGDAARCVKAGIAAYLLKPVKQSDLLFTITRVLKESSTGRTKPSLVTRHSIRESKRKLRVLLAEDNLINQKVATKLLERMGHTVSVAGNGREALDTVEKESFDFVLMDVQMPVMDGLEAVAKLRERERVTGNHIPVVAMTAYAMKGDEERCLEAGMDGYLSKPINGKALYETIERVMAESPVDDPIRTETDRDARALDQAGLMDRVGGDRELLNEIVHLFLESYPSLLEQIRLALRETDEEGLERAAHTLKGAVANFGAESATRAAFTLETMGREQDLQGAPQAVVKLETEIRRVVEELTALKNTIVA